MNNKEPYTPQNPEVFAFWSEIAVNPDLTVDIFWQKLAFAKEKLKQYAIPLNAIQELAQAEWELTVVFLERSANTIDLSKETEFSFCVLQQN